MHKTRLAKEGVDRSLEEANLKQRIYTLQRHAKECQVQQDRDIDEKEWLVSIHNFLADQIAQLQTLVAKEERDLHTD